MHARSCVRRLIQHQSQTLSCARQARHHCSNRNCENIRNLGIGHILCRNEQKHTSLLLRQLADHIEDVLLQDTIFLEGAMRQNPLFDCIDRNVRAAPGLFAQAADREIVQDSKDPGAGIVVATAMPIGDDAFEAILDEIVGLCHVTQKPACIPPQSRYHRFDQRENIVHHASSAALWNKRPPRSDMVGAKPSVGLRLDHLARALIAGRRDHQVATLIRLLVLDNLPDRAEGVDDGRARRIGHESRQRL